MHTLRKLPITDPKTRARAIVIAFLKIMLNDGYYNQLQRTDPFLLAVVVKH